MKQTLPFLAVILFLTAFSLKAQITITRADFPEPGNLVISAIDDVTQIDPGPPGTNLVWDFSNLVTSGYDSVFYIPPAGAPGYQNHPEANIVANHNPQQFPNGYNMNFWNYSDDGIKAVADETLINLWSTLYIALHLTYEPPANQLSLPFSYGSSSTQDWVLEWITATRNGSVVTDSALTISHGTVSLLGDAHGTLILPDGSFPVIRVKETCSTVDSTFIWTGSSWSYDSDTTNNWIQYRWYANDYGEVGFYTTNSKKGNGFTFFKSETLVGQAEPWKNSTFTVCPNPASSSFSIITDTPVERTELLDNTGRVVMTAEKTSSVDISMLPAGIYLVKCYYGTRTSTSKLVKL